MSNDTVPASAEGLPNSDLDAELIKLGGELDEVHRQRLASDEETITEEEEKKLFDEHWALREKIDAIPAKTGAGRRVKARAVAVALHFDLDHENDGSGSFASLSQSLCRDLLAEQKPATAEDWAAIDFDPWTHADDEWTPPTAEEWRDIGQTHLITVRLAWAILYQTKPQLVEGMKEIDDVLGARMMNDFRTAIHFFESTAQILNFAQTRLICAGSVLEVAEDNGGDNPENEDEREQEACI